MLHAVDLEAVNDISSVDCPVDSDTSAGGWTWFLGLQGGSFGNWRTHQRDSQQSKLPTSARFVCKHSGCLKTYLGFLCVGQGCWSWKCWPWRSPQTPAGPWDPTPMTRLHPELLLVWPQMHKFIFSLEFDIFQIATVGKLWFCSSAACCYEQSCL